jgi:hypothetical protein
VSGGVGNLDRVGMTGYQEWAECSEVFRNGHDDIRMVSEEEVT